MLHLHLSTTQRLIIGLNLQQNLSKETVGGAGLHQKPPPSCSRPLGSRRMESMVGSLGLGAKRHGTGKTATIQFGVGKKLFEPTAKRDAFFYTKRFGQLDLFTVRSLLGNLARPSYIQNQ